PFGRSDTDSSNYATFKLLSGMYGAWWSSRDVGLGFSFSKRDGVNYTGWAGGCYLAAPTPCATFGVLRATASLSGIRDIMIMVPDRAFTFRGTIASDGTLTGVDQTGRMLRLYYHESY